MDVRKFPNTVCYIRLMYRIRKDCDMVFLAVCYSQGVRGHVRLSLAARSEI